MIDCWFWGGLCVVCYQRNKQTKQQHSNNYKSISAVTHWAMFAKQGSKLLSLGNHFATYQHICTSFIVFSMQLEKINVIFSLIYSVILGIFWVTFFSKHMWGSVQVIWMILACATYCHFIYHPTWVTCSEIQYQQTWWDNFFFLNIYDYFDNFLTLECKLDHVAEDLCDTIKGSRFLATCW